VKEEDYDEKMLIQRLRMSDPVAFERLFSHYSIKLYQFSLSYLKSEADAEDIVEEVFFKIWNNREAIKTGMSFQSYLFTITLNFIKRSFNKRSRADLYKRELLKWSTGGDDQPESSIVYQDLLNKLDLLISRLPERRKQIFIERKINEKPVKQIAREMGITPKTVENQLTRTLNSLREELRKDSFDGLLFFHLFVHEETDGYSG